MRRIAAIFPPGVYHLTSRLLFNIPEYDGVEQKDYGKQDSDASQVVAVFYIESDLIVLVEGATESRSFPPSDARQFHSPLVDE